MEKSFFCQSFIHPDILAIIFAYCGINKRRKLTAISQRCEKLCSSYTYIMATKDIDETFAFGCRDGCYQLVQNCLTNRGSDLGWNNLINRISPCSPTGIIRLLLADGRINPTAGSNSGILNFAIFGNLEVCQLLATDPRVSSDPNFSQSLVGAATYGKTEVVRFLLGHPQIDPIYRHNMAMIQACKNGRLEVVKLLSADERVEISDKFNRPLREAIEGCNSSGDHRDIIRLLLNHPRIDYLSNRDIIFSFFPLFKSNRLESQLGTAQLDIVRLIINHRSIDLSVYENQAIYQAGHYQMIGLLLTDRRIWNTLSNEQRKYFQEKALMAK